MEEAEYLKGLPDHYERCLGPIARGWSDDRCAHGLQVICFEGQPEQGVKTYATLGLSRYIFDQPSGRSTRQELLVSANDGFSPDRVAGFLYSLAEHVMRRGRPLLRGEVLGPTDSVIAESPLTAVYVSNPPFDDLVNRPIDGQAIVFASIIPIAASEARLIRANGWSWFEDQLEVQNPDIWDLARTETIE